MARVLSFSLAGVQIRVDSGWVFLALLIAWSLAAGVFPALYAGLPRVSYWVMALATMAGVGCSIILHELGHTLVARASGISVKSITLFVFGGVAQLAGRPRDPLGELLMALAGPLVSLVLGAVFFGLSRVQVLPTELRGVLDYLGTLNIALALFNLLPAFPMDGGRILRALVWLSTRDLLRSTRMASRAGQVVGALMMAAGVFLAVFAGLAGGLWWVLIGWFVSSLARSELYAVEAREALSDVSVGTLMTPDPVTAAARMSVESFVAQILSLRPHDLIPVIGDGEVIGGIGFKQVNSLARSAWRTTTLRQVCLPLSKIPTAHSKLSVAAAFERMAGAGASRLLVIDDGQLVGILTLKDLARQILLATRLREPSRPLRQAPAVF